jgi:hypothetical protein
MVTNIPSRTLRELVKLSERKEALMAQIQQIDHRMLKLQRHSREISAPARKARVTFSSVPPSKRSGGGAKRSGR